MNTIQKYTIFFASICFGFFCVWGGVSASTEVFARDLSLGMRGSDVLVLQQILREETFFTYPTNTGYFGTQTREALVAYQIANKLPVSGVVDTEVRSVLNKTYEVSTFSTPTEETDLMKTVDLLIALGIIPQNERAHVRTILTNRTTVSNTLLDFSPTNIPVFTIKKNGHTTISIPTSSFGSTSLPVFIIGSTTIPKGTQ